MAWPLWVNSNKFVSDLWLSSFVISLRLSVLESRFLKKQVRVGHQNFGDMGGEGLCVTHPYIVRPVRHSGTIYYQNWNISLLDLCECQARVAVDPSLLWSPRSEFCFCYVHIDRNSSFFISLICMLIHQSVLRILAADCIYRASAQTLSGQHFVSSVVVLAKWEAIEQTGHQRPFVLSELCDWPIAWWS